MVRVEWAFEDKFGIVGDSKIFETEEEADTFIDKLFSEKENEILELKKFIKKREIDKNGI